ncbi:MAG TPA: NADH-quinone oxidoreductase subunit L [Candidatus Obscuribacterales bacterium]
MGASISPLLQGAYWIVLLPFLVGAFIILTPFLFPKLSRDTRGWKLLSMALSVSAVGWGLIQSVFVFLEIAKSQVPYVADVPWFVSGSFTLNMGLLLDNLTAVMLIVVTAVSFLVQIYTHAYMRDDAGYSRFYAYLSLFTGSMLGLVVATNLFQMFFFWELVGVCSYFLIGFWFYKPSAAYACFKAFVVNRIGDFGFLIGILLLLFATWGFWSQPTNLTHGLLSFAGNVDIYHAIAWARSNNTLTVGALTLLACLMFMGPMAKSAQMPLHVWLPDAMEGPTPISALIHAATMVAAGVYMVARAYPIWLNWESATNPVTAGSMSLAFVAWIGGFTAFMAATIALTQVDIKRALAWSTVSQLGYMFVGLGVGSYTGGMFHLFTHAFFKAMLFLCSGAVIHALHGQQDMRFMGGLNKDCKFTHFAFLMGCLAISGCPFFSGFFSKDEIIGSSFSWTGPGHEILGPLMVFTAGMTAFYMFRMYFMTFWNDYRGDVHPHAEGKLTPLTMPLMVLAIPSIFAGWLGFSLQSFQGVGAESPFGAFVHWPTNPAEAANWPVMICSVAASLIGFALAFAMYKTRSLKLNEAIATGMPWLYQFSFNRWYWDDLYHGAAEFLIMIFRGFWTLIDSFVIDNVVNLFAQIAKAIGGLLRYSENGRGQIYALVIFACVAIICVVVYGFVPGG